MMRVRLLYFGALKELQGAAEEYLELPANVSTVAQLTAHLATTKPTLAPYLTSCRVALHEEFAEAGAELSEGAEVALLPPVSGG